MGFHQTSLSRSTRHILSISKLFLLLSPLLIPSYSGAATKAIDEKSTFKVGVILDLDSRLGDQMRMAIEIACQDVNSISSSGSHYIKPYYINSHAKALQAISAAETLIKRKNVKVIIGLETWEGATLVAEIANQSQVPVISFVRGHKTPSLMAETLWPSLFRMSTDESDQIKCIVDIVSSYNRQRVSIIYEAEAYDTTYSKLLNSLLEELGKIGSTIEDQLILQAFSFPTGAEVSLEEKLMKLKGKASPIFIVLGLSSQGSAHFLKEAKTMGLFYGDSTWIFAEEPFANLLTSVEHPGISSTLEGAIGLITYRPKNQAYREFRSKFLNMFHHKYGENFNFEPGINVVQAYDCIMTIKNAIDAVPSHDIMPEFLLDRIPHTRLMGLSGEIQFEKGQLAHRPKFQLVSVNGNEYRELKLWSPNFGISRSIVAKQSSRRKPYAISNMLKTQEAQTSRENKRLVIGVPGRTPFDMFVKEVDGLTGKPKHIGFCIDVFEKAVSLFPDGLMYDFRSHNGTYEDLVQKVHDKSYTAGLTSMLTIRELKPTVTTIERLRTSKARVGCYADGFVCGYLNNTLKFSNDVIVPIRDAWNYEDELRRGNVSAVFLEYPYMRPFFAQNCDGYLTIGDGHRVGGFGFSGEMERLEEKWFSPECTMRNITNERPKLGLDSFWALYGFIIAISTVCLLFACLGTRRNRQDHEEGSNGDNMSVTEMSML
ncbi:hypothetical protein NL676_008281 [Syzygium grande]|nr:hypothetical protein NL676_008281 [Syzygium grande]